ncbi:hypothetical protein Tco_0024147 [Tanacetum coccineum]
MELDREEGFSDVEGSNLDNFGLSHDESFGVDDLDLNINLNLDLNVPHHATHEEVLVSEVPNDHVVKGYVDQQTKHGIGEESVEQGTYDEDDVLMYEESKIVEPDVEVHLFSITKDVPFNNINITSLLHHPNRMVLGRRGCGCE